VIDFRYHLVSIIAVFLALAVGIVLGTAALNGPIQTNLNNNLSRVTSEKRALEGDVEDMRTQLVASDAFAVGVGARLVRDTLADHRVLLVTTPETPPELAERLAPLLQAAGARVGGTLELLPALSDPAQGQLVEDLVAQVVPAGVELPDTDAVGRATAELAAALARTADEPGVDPEEAQAVVSAFAEADLVEFSPPDDAPDEALQPATLAVVLTGPAPEQLAPPEQVAQLAVATMAGAVDARSRGAVLAGPTGSADERGTVRALRSDQALAREVSSVDHADRGTGLMTLVLALAEQRRGGAGAYGTGEGASTAVPGLPAQ
jgi:Copper transport outer membrane protein, MctB